MQIDRRDAVLLDQPASCIRQIDVESKLRDDLAALLLHGRERNEAVTGGLLIDEQIGEHRAFGKQAQFLIDNADLVAAGDARRADRNRLTVEQDLSAVGIRVNTVAPGLIDTPIYGEGEASEAFKAKLGESVLFPHRLGKPDELASMVVELLTNSYMNAEVVRVDGGIRMPPK